MNNAMRSGEPGFDRNAAYYRERWDEIIDKTFWPTVFHQSPALVNRELVNGCRQWQPYEGQLFDPEKYDLVDEMWDHEHCSICNCRINPGDSYWFNGRRVRLLCDECHDFFVPNAG